MNHDHHSQAPTDADGAVASRRRREAANIQHEPTEGLTMTTAISTNPLTENAPSVMSWDLYTCVCGEYASHPDRLCGSCSLQELVDQHVHDDDCEC